MRFQIVEFTSWYEYPGIDEEMLDVIAVPAALYERPELICQLFYFIDGNHGSNSTILCSSV